MYYRIYNYKSRQLEYFIDAEYSSSYWEKIWNSKGYSTKTLASQNKTIKKLVQKYASKGKRIIEAGCGNGHLVLMLKDLGYDAYGVDYAKTTVEEINKRYPELNIRYGNIQKLDFSDKFFDIYISLGVIEHQRNGYNDIMKEAVRILKDESYLFIQFPYMSPLRKLKAFFKLYSSEKKDNMFFYQYALNMDDFLKNSKALDLKVVTIERCSGLKGLKDEITLLSSALQPLFDYSGNNRILIGLRYLLTKVFNIFAAHTVMIVLRKNREFNNETQ